MNASTHLPHLPRSRRARLAALAGVVPAVAAFAVLASAAPASAAGLPQTVSPLPNATIETSYTKGYDHWATTQVSGAPIRSAPNATASVLTTLHIFTSDGLPETYLVWAVEKVKGVKWVQIGVPERPNGVIGWVRANDLGPLYAVHETIVINQPTRTLTLYRNGQAIFSAPVGVGAPSTPTPDGDFWVREKFQVVNDPFYGPYAIGTSNYSNVETDWPGGGVVGIHGTNEPSLVPGDPSHGCVRMHDADITKLYSLVNVGALIEIKG